MTELAPGALVPADARVLLLAPHCDDEALGPGGTVWLMTRAGASVQPVILASSPGVEGGVDEATRQAESRAACEILGTRPPLFLEIPSARLREDPAAAGDRLVELAGADGPYDVVLLPWPLERHATHRASTEAGLLAGGRLARPGAAWWGFGVWDAVPRGPSVVEVDTTAARAAKTRAVAAHRSQMSARPFGAAMASRDMAQAVFSNATGAEERKAVELLLDLRELAAVFAGGAGGGAADLRAWAEAWTSRWAAELWPADG